MTQMAAPFCTFIIPLYRTSNELFSRCLDSIDRQSDSDFEVIVVERESELTSTRPFRENDRHHRIVTSEKGVSIARNTGLDKATGEYVVFVDADDWIDENFVKEIKRKSSDWDNPDLLVFGSDDVKFDSASIDGIYRLDGLRYRLFNPFLEHNPGFNQKSVYAKVFRRQTLGTVRFDLSLTMAEDQFFLFKALDLMTNIGLDRAFTSYHYAISETSNTFTLDNNRPEVYLNIIEAWKRHLLAIPRPSSEKRYFLSSVTAVYIPMMLAHYFCNHDNSQSEKERFHSFKALLKEPDFVFAIKKSRYRDCVNFKKRIQLFYLKTGLVSFLFAYYDKRKNRD